MAGLSQENLLKDVFNKRVITELANSLRGVYPKFLVQQFVDDIMEDFEPLGFLERSNKIKEMLKKHLPEDYPSAVRIIVDALGPELEEPGVTVWDAFIIMPQCAYVSAYGKEHFEESMQALYELTKRFSAENDLRTFIETDYDKAMALLHCWCSDRSPHVRRLVSEGTRPRLPLAGRIKRFQKDPRPVIELLDKLKDDEELYVRRSVANNINDIAKDNRDMAVETLRRWSQSKDKNVQWVIRHSARSLIKEGDAAVLELLSYKPEVKITLGDFKLSKSSYRLGEPLGFSFELISQSENAEPLMIDYVIHYIKAGGKVSQKVFKLRELKLKPGEKILIEKIHKLVNTSGRTHYAGLHEIELQINGKRLGRLSFELTL